MSDSAVDLAVPPPPPPLKKPLLPLHKQNTWSSDAYRDEAWRRRKVNYGVSSRRSKSVTDEDLEELKGCIELGFGFDSPEIDKRLSDTLPAYDLYQAVKKQYNEVVCKVSSSSEECESPPYMKFDSGENPAMVKTRLKQWAQVVACAVRQSLS